MYFYQDLKQPLQTEAPGSAASRLIHSQNGCPSTRGGIADGAGLVFAVLMCHTVWKKGKYCILVR